MISQLLIFRYPGRASFGLIWHLIWDLIWGIIWGYLISNEVIWYQMSSYELKWRLIWAQMTPHMSSNETHLRFGKWRRRTAMRVCVSTLITGGVHIDHPHTTNIAGKSKWIWKFKIRVFFSFEISNEKPKFIGSWKSMKKIVVTKKNVFPKNKKL